jgi:hypothetical protein
MREVEHLHGMHGQEPAPWLLLCRDSDLLNNTPTATPIGRQAGYGWIPHNAGFGFLDLAPSILHSNIGSGTTFPSALCLICPPGYLVWSRTFLLGVGLTDLGDFGRY